MKWRAGIGTALFGVILTATAWAHHMAEGIISDEVWDRVNDILGDTPHLEIDLGSVMGSMRIDEVPEGGSMLLVSSITVDAEDFLDYWTEVNIALDEIHVINGAPTGQHNNSYMPGLIDVDDCYVSTTDVDDCEIMLIEPIGSIGWADDAEEIYDPPEAPGPTHQSGKRGK